MKQNHIPVCVVQIWVRFYGQTKNDKDNSYSDILVELWPVDCNRQPRGKS